MAVGMFASLHLEEHGFVVTLTPELQCNRDMTICLWPTMTQHMNPFVIATPIATAHGQNFPSRC